MQVVPLPLASYNRMPAPTQILGKEKPGHTSIKIKMGIQLAGTRSQVPTFTPGLSTPCKVEVGRRASPPSHDEPDALERHI